MQNNKKLFIFPLFITIISFCFQLTSYKNFAVVNANEIVANYGECVMDANSKRVLSSVNQDVKLPMASTTKILTALTVINNFDVEKTVEVKQNSVGIEGSSIYLRAGEHLTVKELLYGLMLRSGNDCAECLATAFTDRDEFIKLMNETAENLGATNSSFVNPHGLSEDNHYTTAKDLALIASAAINNKLFKEIVSSKKAIISNEGYSYKRVLINKNKMLSNYKGAIGIKTGFTKKAGRCLVSAAERGGFTVVTVVLNCPDMWQRSKSLLDEAYNNFQFKTIINAEEINNHVYSSARGKKFMLYVKKGFSYPVSESDDITVTYNDVSLENYLQKPAKIGEIKVFNKNELIFSQKIFTI